MGKHFLEDQERKNQNRYRIFVRLAITKMYQEIMDIFNSMSKPKHGQLPSLAAKERVSENKKLLKIKSFSCHRTNQPLSEWETANSTFVQQTFIINLFH